MFQIRILRIVIPASEVVTRGRLQADYLPRMHRSSDYDCVTGPR